MAILTTLWLIAMFLLSIPFGLAAAVLQIAGYVIGAVSDCLYWVADLFWTGK